MTRLLTGTTFIISLLLPALPTHADRKGSDPLHASERNQALHAAQEVLTAPAEGSSNGGIKRRELETLLIERRREAKGANTDTRRADVHLYDYETDTLHSLVVDLKTREVVQTSTTQETQLPLTEIEKRRALQIARSEPATLKRLKAEYKDVTATPFNASAKIETATFIFRSDSMPDMGGPEAAQCGLHRCAQVLFFTGDHVVMESSPVVDLSLEQVIGTLSFADSSYLHDHGSHSGGHGHDHAH